MQQTQLVTAITRSSSTQDGTSSMTDLVSAASFHCTSLLQLVQSKRTERQTTSSTTTDADVRLLLFSASELCRSLSLLAGPSEAASNLTSLLAMPTILPAGSSFISTTTTTTKTERLPTPPTASAMASWTPPSSPFASSQAWSPLSSAPSSPTSVVIRSPAPQTRSSAHHQHQFAKLIGKMKRATASTRTSHHGGDAAALRTRPSRSVPRHRAGGSSGGGLELPRVCVECLSSKTSQWRFGPHGPSTLCNACGLKWRKTSQEQQSVTRQRSQKGAMPPHHSSKAQTQLAAEEETVIVID